MKIDLRSVLIGMLLAICFLLATGASRSDTSTANGRYQLCLPGEGSNAYVIDTTTGQVWARVPLNADHTKDFWNSKVAAN